MPITRRAIPSTRTNPPLASALHPISSRNGTFAPVLTSASTPGEPSAFITTTE
jgi:hypothetical protein